VLSKTHRIVRADDFKAAVRTGRRVNTGHLVVYLSKRVKGEADRFGFIVTRDAGNAVTRNTIRRRLRAVAKESIERQNLSMDVVIRALPGSDALTWVSLQGEVFGAITRGVKTQ
jgi:ribonuclease P protein component